MRILRLFFSVLGEFRATYRLEFELKLVESFTMDPFGHEYSWSDAKRDGDIKIILVCVDMA